MYNPQWFSNHLCHRVWTLPKTMTFCPKLWQPDPHLLNKSHTLTSNRGRLDLILSWICHWHLGPMNLFPYGPNARWFHTLVIPLVFHTPIVLLELVGQGRGRRRAGQEPGSLSSSDWGEAWQLWPLLPTWSQSRALPFHLQLLTWCPAQEKSPINRDF